MHFSKVDFALPSDSARPGPRPPCLPVWCPVIFQGKATVPGKQFFCSLRDEAAQCKRFREDSANANWIGLCGRVPL